MCLESWWAARLLHMHFSAALLWSEGAAEFSSSYVMVCWCLCSENLYFSWRVSGAVSYLSWVTAERAAGRGRCAKVWGRRKKQLFSPSSPCVQHFPGSPSSHRSTGAAPSELPRAANGGKGRFVLGQSRVRWVRWDSGRGAERGGGCGGTAGWEMQQQRDRGMESGVRRGDAAAVGPRDESGARGCCRRCCCCCGKADRQVSGPSSPSSGNRRGWGGERGRGTEGSGDVKMQHHPPAPANSACVCAEGRRGKRQRCPQLPGQRG